MILPTARPQAFHEFDLESSALSIPPAIRGMSQYTFEPSKVTTFAHLLQPFSSYTCQVLPSQRAWLFISRAPHENRATQRQCCFRLLSSGSYFPSYPRSPPCTFAPPVVTSGPWIWLILPLFSSQIQLLGDAYSSFPFVIAAFPSFSLFFFWGDLQ